MKNVKQTENEEYNKWAHFIGETVLIQRVHYEMKAAGRWKDGTVYMAPLPIPDEEVREILIWDVALEEKTNRVYVKYQDVATQEEKWFYPRNNWAIVGPVSAMKHGEEEGDMPDKKVKE